VELVRGAGASLSLDQQGRAIVERLGGAWRAGGAMCRCPAHDDRSPSLSVRAGERRLLFHCYKDASGFTAKDTEWHRVTCFNGLGRVMAQHAKKGMLVSVSGRLHNSKWTDSEGVERYGYEIIADDVQFLSRPRAAEAPDDQSEPDEDAPF
jgi:hypothetical protein